MMPNGQNANQPINNLDLETKEKLASYVLDYLRTLGCTRAADAFQTEIMNTDIRKIPEVDTPNILLGWFSIFYELYCAAPDRRHMYDISSDAKAFYDCGFIQNPQLPQGPTMGPSFPQPTGQFPNPVPQQVPMSGGANQGYYQHKSTENGNGMPMNNVNQRMPVPNMMNQPPTHQQFPTSQPQPQQLQSTNQQLRSLINERSQSSNINNGMQENRMNTMNYQPSSGQHQYMDNTMMPPNGMQPHMRMGNEPQQMNVDPRYMNMNQGYNQQGYQMNSNPTNPNLTQQTQQQKALETNPNLNSMQPSMMNHAQM
uniref:LisH domain-containing protein n=1 Tax=Parastrongyloides trichosuri TaxID=131310 RepID=A0A0N4ZAZ7_PARTI